MDPKAMTNVKRRWKATPKLKPRVVIILGVKQWR